jgi:hypothetical protein
MTVAELIELLKDFDAAAVVVLGDYRRPMQEAWAARQEVDGVVRNVVTLE